jgi:hypothetical protein
MIIVRNKYILQFIVKIFYSLLALSFTLRGKDNHQTCLAKKNPDIPIDIGTG